MSSARIIWVVAAVLYAAFLGWHENWRGALTPAEQEYYLQKLDSQSAANKGLDKAARAKMAEFIRADDGKEFFMLNLVQYPRGLVAHPKTGAATAPADLLQEYFAPFISIAFVRGAYPAFTGPIVGGYIEEWGVEAKAWSGAGLIRYRSRRDFLEAATNPEFSNLHIYKRAAIAATLATPMQVQTAPLLSPRLWLLFLLIAIVALLHLFIGRKNK